MNSPALRRQGRFHPEHGVEMMGLKALDVFPVLDETESFWIDEVEHAVLMHITEGVLRGHDCYGVAGTCNRHGRGGTVSKRYEIAHDYHDGCIGLRLVFSAAARHV